MLLDAGANGQAVNGIGKSASELAAFVGQHECVSVISSYISRADVDRILHPQGAASEPQFSPALTQFIHELTRTHAFHPVRLVMDIVGRSELIWTHRKKVVWTVDRLFERQLRTRQPNEVLSIKLWLILHTLRALLKFVAEKLPANKSGNDEGGGGEEEEEGTSTSSVNANNNKSEVEEEKGHEEAKLARLFAQTLLMQKPDQLVRPNEERFIRQAIAAFPYKQSMLWQALSKQFAQIPFGSPPSAFVVLCHALAGPRFVQTAHFCRCCFVPSAQKRCRNCKLFYCSKECQRFDWPIHRRCCEELKRRQLEEEEEQAQEMEQLPATELFNAEHIAVEQPSGTETSEKSMIE